MCQEHGGLGANHDAGDGVGEEEDGGEVLDAHANEALCDGDGVFGHELLECDEEAGLDGDAARDCGVAAAVSDMVGCERRTLRT